MKTRFALLVVAAFASAAIAADRPAGTGRVHFPPRDFRAEPPAWRRLFTHVGHDDKDTLPDSLGIDVRHLETPAPPEHAIGGGLFQNFWGGRFSYQPTAWGPLRQDAQGALAGAGSFAKLEAFAWPTPDCLDRSRLKEQCRRHERPALLYGFADVWQRPALVRGWEAMSVDMAERAKIPRAGFSRPTAQSSANRYSRSACVRLRAKPSSPSTSAIVCALRCWRSQIFSSTVPGAMSR